jgi:hypothetical protein
MRYVIAGYVIVLGLLFLYAVQLTWRRRRLSRTVARIASTAADAAAGTAVDPTAAGRTVVDPAAADPTSGDVGPVGPPVAAARERQP